VELLVPELQKRGVYWADYPVPGGTLRENINSQPGCRLLADDHPGSKFRWNAPKPEKVPEHVPVLDAAAPADMSEKVIVMESAAAAVPVSVA
jgi:hypothetical protein